MSTMDNTAIPEIAACVPDGLQHGLWNYWYPILQSEELPSGRPKGMKLLGAEFVAWRDAAGKPQVIQGWCPHRAVQLSLGRVLEGQLQCAFHGLRFDGSGQCVLVPWEDKPESAEEELRARAYPAEELGGYVWVYLGDAEKFPPPRLADEVPEELSKDDEFRCYRVPTQVWRGNWLLTIDGSDAFHAVTLHAESQAVEDRDWSGGGVNAPAVPLKDRRVKIVETPYGIRGVAIDKKGHNLHHGHLLKDTVGARFNLPCLTTNPIVPVPGVPPYVARLWQFPVDEHSTMIARYVCWRLSDVDQSLDLDQLFAEVVGPRLEKVAREDQAIAAAQGDLVVARQRENLLEPDGDMYEVRERIKDAYLAGVRGERIAPASADLVFPLVESASPSAVPG